MNKRVIIIGLAVCLLASACGAGGAPPPTTDPNSIINTAQAAAFTMIAETQAAIPTATLTELPSPTPLATDTPILPPTLEPTAASLPTTTSASANTSGDPCHVPLAPDAAGPKTYIRVKNKTNKPITGILKLWVRTPHGECGYLPVNIAGNDSATYSPPVGYYYISVYTKSGRAYGEAIISDDHLVEFEVYEDWVKVIYP